MSWTLLSRHLALDEAQHLGGAELLRELHASFEGLCRRPWTASADSPLEALARHVHEGGADAAAASDHLCALLQRPEGGRQTRLAETQELVAKARAGIERMLGAEQLARWRALAPPNLLDLAPEGATFADAVARRVAQLRRPRGFLCTSPFEYAHVQANGDVYPCCPSKFGKIIGNLRTSSLDEVWRSEAAAEARASMLDGSHRHCNAMACEYLRDALTREKPIAPPDLVAWARGEGMLDAGPAPRTLNCAFDRSCNLSCDYCRAEPFRPTAEERRSIARIDANIFDSLLQGTERIILLGEGDPFASPFYRKRLESYDWGRHPRLRIKIQTNGLLLTRAMWARIEGSHAAIDWVSVSVDAASPETYRLNRGGDFDTLRRNLAFVAELFAAGALRHFHINFLVQGNNFHEVPAFARLGRELGCDLIEFQRLENWGHYTEAEYRERAVHEPYHPQHAALRRVLTHPDLRHPAVWLLKLGDCVADAGSVDVVAYDNCA